VQGLLVRDQPAQQPKDRPRCRAGNIGGGQLGAAWTGAVSRLWFGRDCDGQAAAMVELALMSRRPLFENTQGALASCQIECRALSLGEVLAHWGPLRPPLLVPPTYVVVLCCIARTPALLAFLSRHLSLGLTSLDVRAAAAGRVVICGI
jgi:hypothetical protein